MSLSKRNPFTPIECNDESEQVESTALFHLSGRPSAARRSVDAYASVGLTSTSTQPIGVQSPMCVISPPYELPRETSTVSVSSHIYIKPNTSQQMSADDIVPNNADNYKGEYKHKIQSLESHKDSVLCVATHNQYIFSGSQDCSIGVWNTNTFELEDTLLGHSRSVLGLYVMNPQGLAPCLVSTAKDNCICLWDIASFSLLFRITGFPSLVYDIECLSFGNDGYYLYGCCQDTNIFVLSLSILPYLLRLHHDKLSIEHEHKQQMASFKNKYRKRNSESLEKTTIANDSEPMLIDANDVLLLRKPSILCPKDFNGPCLDTEEPSVQPQDSTRPSSNSKFELPTSTSAIVRLIQSDVVVQFLSKSVSEMVDIYYDLVYDSEDKPFMIDRIFCGCHRGFIYILSRIETEYRLISCSSDGTCKIWDASNQYKLQLLSVLTGHTHSVIDCDLFMSSSGRYLVTASRDETVKVWNISEIAKPHTRHTTEAHDSELTAVKVIESVIVCASRSGHVIFRNAQSYDVIATHCVSKCAGICVMRFAFMEPSWLLLCDTANAVQIWNIAEILSITATNDTMAAVLSRDHHMIADLRALVAFKSISCNSDCESDCWNAAYFIQRLSEQFGAETRLIQGNAGKNPVVLAKFSNKCNSQSRAPPKRIVMHGHYDVVDIHSPQLWNSPPFDLTGRNGYLYGRGASNNKGAIVVFLYAIREILEEDELQDNIEIIVIIEGHEEHGWKTGGFTHVVEQNMDWLSAPAPAVIICSSSCWIGDAVPCLVYGMRGNVELNIEINGCKQDIHAGVHGGGAFTEPTFELMSLLSKLKDNNVVRVPGFYDEVAEIDEDEQALYDEIVSRFDTQQYLDSLGIEIAAEVREKARRMATAEDLKNVLMQRWRHPVLSVHNVQQSSNQSNVISKCASAVIAIRTVPNQNNVDIITKCKKYLLDEFDKSSTFQIKLNTMRITAKNIGDYWLQSTNHFVFECAQKAIVKHWKCKPFYIRQGDTIPSTNYLHHKLKAPILQIPLGQATDRAHLDNERIRLQNLLKGKLVIKSFLVNLIRHQHHQNQHRHDRHDNDVAFYYF
eukprot:841002_1